MTGRALAGVLGAAAAFAVVAAAIAVARRPKRRAALAPDPPAGRAPARSTAPPRRSKRPADTSTSDVDAPFSMIANGDESPDRRGARIAAIAHIGAIERHPAHSQRRAGNGRQERDPARRSTLQSPVTIAWHISPRGN